MWGIFGKQCIFYCQTREQKGLSFRLLGRTIGTHDSGWDILKKGDLGPDLEIAKHDRRYFENIDYFKGWIPSRFNQVEDKTFSFVPIDVDIYEPTKDSL